MVLDEFIEQKNKDAFPFYNLLDKEGIATIKATVGSNMADNHKDYDTAKVEFQVFTENDNFEPRVEISSDDYSDGEVVFLDYHLD